MNLLNIFGEKESRYNISSKSSILKNPGDKLEACITKSNRKVLKISKDNGKTKYSATQYPNGTMVETKVTKNNHK